RIMCLFCAYKRRVGGRQITEKVWRPRRDLNPCYRRESIVTNRTQRHGSQRLELEETLRKSYRTLIEPFDLALHWGRVNRGRDEVESPTPAFSGLRSIKRKTFIA